jgi:Family of unknown function (DUF6282)
MVKNNIEFSAESLELMKGAIEIHVHPGPSLFPRSVNDRELAEQARNRGMRAVVLKAHEESTVSRAKIANDGVEGISIFGSIVLNMYVGGLTLCCGYCDTPGSENCVDAYCFCKTAH